MSDTHANIGASDNSTRLIAEEKAKSRLLSHICSEIADNPTSYAIFHLWCELTKHLREHGWSVAELEDCIVGDPVLIADEAEDTCAYMDYLEERATRQFKVEDGEEDFPFP